MRSLTMPRMHFPRMQVGASVEENVYRLCAARAVAMDLSSATARRSEAPLSVRCAAALCLAASDVCVQPSRTAVYQFTQLVMFGCNWFEHAWY